MESQLDKKRVAKNTFFLYFRMALIMLVQFYTVRVTLQCLGIADYGIYNLVAGVTNMLTFLTHTMTSASQRFFAYDLGIGNIGKLKTSFDTTVLLFVVVGLISVFLLELIGNWLIVYQLIIPADRLSIAKYVFQFSLLSLFLTIITLPFNSLIIAHEDMKTFAYVSVIEAILKLLIIYILFYIQVDKLLLYAALVFGVQALVSFTYIAYCFKKYEECDKLLSFDVSVVKSIVPFMSWNLLGGVSWMLCTQGLTILVNMFFGPIANAAKAIADKLDGSVNSFMNNFMMATQPQIVKTYANGEMKEMHTLIFLSSRISFYLTMSLSIPFIFNAETLLILWLGHADQLTIRMTQLILIFSLIGSLENPINQSIRATGKIRNYQLYISLITFCVLPLAYFFFRGGLPAYFGYIALIIVYGFALIARLHYLKKQIGISYYTYFTNVILRQVICLALACLISIYVCNIIQASDMLISLIRVIMLLVISITIIGVIGLTSIERKKLTNFIKTKYKAIHI